MPLLDIVPQPDMSLAKMAPMIEMGAISDAEFEAANVEARGFLSRSRIR